MMMSHLFAWSPDYHPLRSSAPSVNWLARTLHTSTNPTSNTEWQNQVCVYSRTSHYSHKGDVCVYMLLCMCVVYCSALCLDV